MAAATSSASSIAPAVAGSGGDLVIRVRGKDGMWRVDRLSEAATIGDLKARLEQDKGIAHASQIISREAGGPGLLDSSSLGSLGVRRGDILFVSYEGSVEASTVAAAIAAAPKVIRNGEVVVAPEAAALPAMRAIKKQWNWMDYMDLTRSLEFTVQPQKAAHCKRVTLDSQMIEEFARHAQGLAFQTRRLAFLYGFITDEHETIAVCSYEPPQIASPSEFRCVGRNVGSRVRALLDESQTKPPRRV